MVSDSTTTATPTSRPDTPVTEPPTQVPTNSPTATESPTPTETETPTPDPYTQKLDQVEQTLIAELDSYKTGEDITSRALDNKIYEPITDRLYQTRSLLGELKDDPLSENQQKRRSRLQEAHWFVWWTKTVHKEVANMIDSAETAWANKRGYAVLNKPVNPLEDAIVTVESRLESLKSDASASGVAELNEYSEEDYTAVVDRYSNAISLANTLVENIQDHIEANSTWGLEQYEDAREQYNQNLESHKNPDWVSELQPIADEMICYAETMIERCDAFIHAKELEEAGEEEDAETERNLAPKPSEECDFDNEE